MSVKQIEQRMKQWNERCGNTPCNNQHTLYTKMCWLFGVMKWVN